MYAVFLFITHFILFSLDSSGTLPLFDDRVLLTGSLRFPFIVIHVDVFWLDCSDTVFEFAEVEPRFFLLQLLCGTLATAAWHGSLILNKSQEMLKLKLFCALPYPTLVMPQCCTCTFTLSMEFKPKYHAGSPLHLCHTIFYTFPSLQKHDRLSTCGLDHLALRSQSLNYLFSHWCRPQLGLASHAVQEVLCITWLSW